jgi:hypothetical protein
MPTRVFVKDSGDPHDEDDPIAVFVRANRGVYNALQALLLDAHLIRDGRASVHQLSPLRHAQLVGGQTQWQVLTALAEENGLAVRVDGGALQLEAEPYALRLLVTAELPAPDPQSQMAVG